MSKTSMASDVDGSDFLLTVSPTKSKTASALANAMCTLDMLESSRLQII